MKILKARIDDYWARHSSQTSLFYASVAIIILLFGVAFLLLRVLAAQQASERTHGAEQAA